ncbi:restriction endonuclease subunit S [Helicobacter ganmani]|uniref:restriction endonuclease subunit S n=1 Tax=Helicobacter ganmani TaxID=60246 RepID=UPI003A8669D4
MPSLLQNLPQGWEVKTLGEVCEITMGQSPKGEQVFSHNKISSCHSDLECNEREESQKDSTLKDISATPQCGNSKNGNDFMEFHQGKICFTDKYISESEFVTTDIKKFAEKDSILLCVRAPVGIINITKRKVAIGRGLCALKMKSQNNDFLYFYLLTLENYFNQKATGSTFSAITMNVVKNTPIPLPPLETQKAIVEKLENAFAHIDEAVRHLKSVQTNIPRLKSSLLHSAFSGKLTESQNQSHEMQTLKSVVGEKGEFERKEGETSPFKPPHPLIKTEIPQGLEFKTLGEVCEFVYGKALNQTKRKTNGKYPVYAANGIKDYSDEFMISENSIIVGRKGSVGSVVLTSSPCWVLDVAYYVNFDKEKYNLVFLYHLLKYLNLKQFARGVKPGISRSQIYELQVVMPPLATQNQIVQILESKFTHLDNLAQFVNASLENLQRLKSSLLNQAFKGELIC